MREGREHEVTIKGHKFEVVELLVKHAYAESIQIKEDNAQVILKAIGNSRYLHESYLLITN